jgi:hypothetical protein
VRTFVWWFNIGALTTLSVLMVQGGVHDLLYGTRSGGAAAYLTFAITILGGVPGPDYEPSPVAHCLT